MIPAQDPAAPMIFRSSLFFLFLPPFFFSAFCYFFFLLSPGFLTYLSTRHLFLFFFFCHFSGPFFFLFTLCATSVLGPFVLFLLIFFFCTLYVQCDLITCLLYGQLLTDGPLVEAPLVSVLYCRRPVPFFPHKYSETCGHFCDAVDGTSIRSSYSYKGGCRRDGRLWVDEAPRRAYKSLLAGGGKTTRNTGQQRTGPVSHTLSIRILPGGSPVAYLRLVVLRAISDIVV